MIETATRGSSIRNPARLFGFLVLLLLAGCAHLTPIPPLPTAPHHPWAAPEAPPLDDTTTTSEIDVPEWLRNATVSLAQVVDLALRNSPATRQTWLSARAAENEVESRQADLYPQLDASLDVSRIKSSAVGGLFTFQQTTWGPGIDLSYVLFDFGGTRADVEEARRLLVAASFSHNAAIQDVVLTVEEAYYQYAAAREARAAVLADLSGAHANLAAAEARHDAGVATIADVLQARTAASQVQLRLYAIEGAMKAASGALLTAMGLPADLPVDVEEMPSDLPLDTVQTTIDVALQEAILQRPDLLATRALAEAAAARADRIRSEGLPSLLLRGSADRVNYATVPGSTPANNWSATLSLRYPLFSGGRHRADLEQARHETEAAAARSEQLAQQARLEVWTSYYELETAAQRVRASRDLLASASQSAEVTAGRYRAGVGSILDLLAAQAVLAEARSQEVAARADWLIAVARLARDSGVLNAPTTAVDPTGPSPSPIPATEAGQRPEPPGAESQSR